MRTTTTAQLAALQKNPTNIRNICILAHVDHGKTTLADTLVASNGIISQRLAGKLRYLDSREDEQLRGITMKSSAISLSYCQDGAAYLVNLIDSPGHIDFSSEVSTAVRLCDGALVLIDVAEGVCPQTHAVLRQAWLENIKPVLILNKLDRLITELKMSPLEAHRHLQQILEQVNCITGELFTSEMVGRSEYQEPHTDSSSPDKVIGEEQLYDWSSGLEKTDDSKLYFSPDQGNVVFASALDGWGFGIQHFAQMFASKLGFKEEVLRKTLWGDFYLETKTKRIKKGALGKGKKPLFVQFILENLWAVYDAIITRRDKDMTEKIVKSLNLKILPRDLRHNDPHVLLNAVTRQWLPLSAAVLAMVIQCLPSPVEVSAERVEKLLCSGVRRFDSLPQQTQHLQKDFLACSPAAEAPVIVYVSKMFCVDSEVLPHNKQRRLTPEEIAERGEIARKRHGERMAALESNKVTKQTPPDEGATGNSAATCEEEKQDNPDQAFIAFARVFSGTVRRGTKLYVLGPKHDPAAVLEQLEDTGGDLSALLATSQVSLYIHEFTVGEIYLIMGKELEAMEEIPAGNILGLGGLEELVLKSATLSSTVACPAFTEMYQEAPPIVRVALEPAHLGDMRQLMKGLKLLNQADPCVRVFVQETGEHVIVTAGEVHLQKCVDDLRNRYAKIDIKASEPIVPFRESIVTAPTMDMVNEAIEPQLEHSPPPGGSTSHPGSDLPQVGTVKLQTPNKLCTIQIQAVPLPEEVTTILEDSTTLIKTLEAYASARFTSTHTTEPTPSDQNTDTELQIGFRINQSMLKSLHEFHEKLHEAFKQAGPFWEDSINQIWSFGPKRNGPNLLLNRVKNYNRYSIWTCLNKANGGKLWDFDNSIVSGFQMATLSGPLCEEPMRGVCFIVKEWDTDKELRLKERSNSERERTYSRMHSISGIFSDESDEEFVVDDLNTDKKLHASSSCESDARTESENNTVSQVTSACDNTSDIVAATSVITLESSPASSEPPVMSSSMTKPEDSSKSKLPVAGASTEVNSNLKPGDRSNSKSVVPEVSRRKDPTSYGAFSGQLMSSMKEGCRRAFQSQPQRLMVAMYSCVIQATTDVLGKLYGVIGKRNGRVCLEDLREGTSMFNISAVIPVVESFGFSEEVRKKTSGLASPQLKFSHWEVIDLDPFWVPTTEEEYMHFGEKADSENQARFYMNQVRRRKGLKVDEKLVEFGEKQRTLSKNK